MDVVSLPLYLSRIDEHSRIDDLGNPSSGSGTTVPNVLDNSKGHQFHELIFSAVNEAWEQLRKFEINYHEKYVGTIAATTTKKNSEDNKNYDQVSFFLEL